jgi:hypothetical protein
MSEHESRPSYQLVRLQGSISIARLYTVPAKDVGILVKARQSRRIPPDEAPMHQRGP